MDEKTKKLIEAAKALLNGDHLWDYHKYLDNGGEPPEDHAKRTQIAVVNLEVAIEEAEGK